MADTITPQDLRLAIRTKVEDGVNRRSISELIQQFVQPRGAQLDRIAVERIPAQKCAAFLDALNRF